MLKKKIIILTHDNIIKLIINSYSKYLNSKDKLGKTPIHYLVNSINLNLIEIVGQKGADFNIEDNNGVTPFEIACLSKNKLLITSIINLGKNTFTRRGCSLITYLLKIKLLP